MNTLIAIIIVIMISIDIANKIIVAIKIVTRLLISGVSF